MKASKRYADQQRLWALWLCAAPGAALTWSWIGAADRMTWWLESFPALIGVPVLIATYRWFQFTRLAYALIAAHICILLVGAHYTYAEVPLFNWIRDHFHLARNDYDKVGHLAQGFVPAIVAREVLVRRKIVNGACWRLFVVMCICMAISACYGLLEWAVALAEGSGADGFLGTQGDPWDTQSDMFCALVGAASTQLLLTRLHNREIAHLDDARSERVVVQV